MWSQASISGAGLSSRPLAEELFPSDRSRVSGPNHRLCAARGYACLHLQALQPFPLSCCVLRASHSAFDRLSCFFPSHLFHSSLANGSGDLGVRGPFFGFTSFITYARCYVNVLATSSIERAAVLLEFSRYLLPSCHVLLQTNVAQGLRARRNIDVTDDTRCRP